mgnify:FL=1
MQRFFSIFFVALATFGTVALSAVPHHHHGHEICFDKHCCVGHDHSGNSSESGHDESDCQLTHSFYLFNADHSLRPTSGIHALFSVLFVPAQGIDHIFVVPAEVAETDYGEFIAVHYLRTTSSALILRAPPVA